MNLERTNLGDLSAIPADTPIGAVTMDLSYLSVADAVPQIETLSFAADAQPDRAREADVRAGARRASRRRPVAPTSAGLAVAGVERVPWHVVGTMPSPVTGSKGAREWLLHARRTTDGRIIGGLPGPAGHGRPPDRLERMERAVILEGARTPVGKFLGSFADVPAVELGTIAAREAMRRAAVEPGRDRSDDRRSRPTGRERPEHRPAGQREGRRPGRGRRLQRQHRLRLRDEGHADRRAADRARRRRGRPGRRHGEHDPRAVPAAADAAGLPDGERRRRRRDVPRRAARPAERPDHGRDGREPGRHVRHHARGAGRVRARVPAEGARRHGASGGRDRPGRRRRVRRARRRPSRSTSIRGPTRRWRRSGGWSPCSARAAASPPATRPASPTAPRPWC